MSSAPLFESDIQDLACLARGKVRDIYAIDEDHLLFVATDRLSAFDVVLPNPVPDKGRILTELSCFWFDRTRDLIENHLTGIALTDVLPDANDAMSLAGRALVVRRLTPLPIESIVRGYIAGSGWRDYQSTGGICGIALPPGLTLAEALPETLFTPSSKAAVGDHDENISFDQCVALIGAPLAKQVRDVSIALYERAARYARGRGIIIADTKFEFGLDDQGTLILIDEVLTPDSSRFWPEDSVTPGQSPPSFDKQFVRDFLDEIGWDHTPPAPSLPPAVIEETARKYREALVRLTT